MKRRKLRPWVKELPIYLLLVLLFVGSMYLLIRDGEVQKENAIERCGGVDNIVEKYTNQGDVYYNCKVYD